MCHQSVGLIQSVIEKSGIPTVSITVLPEVTARVAPPRALIVDRPLGFPLGEPLNVGVQTEIVMTALRTLSLNGGGVHRVVERWSAPVGKLQ